VTCDAVELCKQEIQPKAMAIAAIPTSNAAENSTKGENANGRINNGRAVNGNQGAPAEIYRLTIIIHETEDEEKDEAYLNRLRDILKEYPGRDEVYLKIVGEDSVTNLKWQSIFVNYSPDLKKKLSRLVSEENLVVEKL